MNRRVEIKAEQIARLVVKGWKGTQIAIEMGMSYDGLQRILRQPEYLAIEQRVRQEVLGRMDARLAKRAAMEEEVEDTVPEAMRILIDQVTKKRDLKAALELLDRDPRRQFSKSKPGAQPDASGVAPGLGSEALGAAIKDADLTHSLIQKKQQVADQQPDVVAKQPLSPAGEA